MRIFSAIAGLFIATQSALATDMASSGVIYSVPDDFNLSRQFSMQAHEYRGPDGVRWSVNIIKLGSGLPEDRKDIEGALGRRESELKRMVGLMEKSKIPHHFERKILDDESVLLVLGQQMLRTGDTMPPHGQIYSTVDFYVFWKDINLVGSIEWPGDLRPQIDRYIERISNIKRTNAPSQSFNMDAQQPASPTVVAKQPKGPASQ